MHTTRSVFYTQLYSVVDLDPYPDSMGSLDLYPDPDFGSKRAKIPIEIEHSTKIKAFEVLDVLF
jgi:hypothetical protein